MNRAALLSSARADWCTPTVVLARVRAFDAIGLDPCSSDAAQVGAREAWEVGGLERSWAGRGLVYVNPPYGRAIAAWTEKVLAEARAGVEILELLPARTDTEWWHRDVVRADGICWRGRLVFDGASAGAPFPSAIAYYGSRTARFREVLEGCGWTLARRSAA